MKTDPSPYSMRLYGDSRSGNCYKVKLLLHLLGQAYEWVEVDIMKRETRKREFLRLNPSGKVPILQLDDGVVLAESNAILFYLAEATPFGGGDPLARAQILQWMFFEQYSHEPNIAVARFIAVYLGLPADRKEEYEAKQKGGGRALRTMEKHLATTPYMAANQLTVADISLYAYTHIADEGGFDLSVYGAIQAWIQRIQAHPKYIDML